jgi:hypothetical protein
MTGAESTLEDGLRALEEAAELARSIRIELDDDYLRAITLAEAQPQNHVRRTASRVHWCCYRRCGSRIRIEPRPTRARRDSVGC